MDYRLWLQTMYCNFGEKWVKLHRGPMWCIADSAQHVEGASSATRQQQKTMKVSYIYIFLLMSMISIHTGFGKYISNF